MRLPVLVLVTAVALWGCGSRPAPPSHPTYMVGTYAEASRPGVSLAERRYIKLRADGTCMSRDPSHLFYGKWNEERGRLVLTWESENGSALAPGQALSCEYDKMIQCFRLPKTDSGQEGAHYERLSIEPPGLDPSGKNPAR